MSWKIIRSEKGSSAIEFSLYTFVFFLMCACLMDISFVITERSHMDRVNNSLMMIFRERSAFYDGVETISQTDLKQLKIIADTLLRKKDGSIDDYQLAIRMVYFKNDSNEYTRRPYELFYTTQKVGECDIVNNKSFTDRLAEMSVWGLRPTAATDESAFWNPIYEVTLCIPGAVSVLYYRVNGMFNSKRTSLYIRSASLPR